MRNFVRVALIMSAFALFTACEGSQPSIFPPGDVPQTSKVPAARAVAGPTRLSSSYQVLYDFNLGHAGEGSGDPLGGLLNVDGTLYGTTLLGRGTHHVQTCHHTGGFKSCGVIYSISTSGGYKTVHAFHGGAGDGANPQAGLIDVNGTLYGTTELGGSGCNDANGCGTVYSISTTGKEKRLHSFIGGSDGAHPEQGNLLYMNGTLYGTTPNGGNYGCYSSEGCGTVYSVTASGAEKVLHAFGSSGDGVTPQWGLIDVNGTMYGTTEYGGAHSCGDYGRGYGCGTVYSISPSGVEKVLYSFTGGSDGAVPNGGLVDVKGTLYGTTELGGGGAYCGGTDPGCGVVYSITTTGKETVLYSFLGGSDGKFPIGPLIAAKGLLYGATAEGGAGACSGGHCGTIFSVTTTGVVKVLYRFTGGADGSRPDAPLIDVNGTLYSTTNEGGAYGWGTIFALSP